MGPTDRLSDNGSTSEVLRGKYAPRMTRKRAYKHPPSEGPRNKHNNHGLLDRRGPNPVYNFAEISEFNFVLFIHPNSLNHQKRGRDEKTDYKPEPMGVRLVNNCTKDTVRDLN